MFCTSLVIFCSTCSATYAQTHVLNEDYKLIASDGEANDKFGWPVHISGDMAIVGARRDDDNGDDSGSAYIFRFDGSAWIEESKLVAGDGATDDMFGRSVSISGEKVIVGADGNDDNGMDSGSAYIYRFDGNKWIEEAKLLASDGAAYDNFGVRVSLAGDTAIVGAFRDTDNGNGSGSAYIYRFDGKQWIEEVKLLASDGENGDMFGRSVSTNGEIVIIGAPRDNGNGMDSGSVYIYRFDGKKWIEEVELLASDGSSMDNFGWSVCISNDMVIVGARQEGEFSHGSAYIYRFDGSAWIEEAKLLASDGSTSDEFGHSVSISGDIAIVGAGADDDIGNNSGSAYIYRFDGIEWVETKLHASDAAASDNFGLTVSISGNTAIIGARNDNDNGDDSGSAYIFNFGHIWTVDDDGMADFNNIQEAVDAASGGDEIVVKPGTYMGVGDQVVDMLGKAVWLHSSDGSEMTIIDGESVRRGIVCASGETSETIIEGLTITGGFGNQGGGLYCLGSSPTLRRCSLSNNYATFGGGAYCSGDSTAVAFYRCTFEGNSVEYYGGGMFFDYYSIPTLTECSILNNSAATAGGVYCEGGSIPTLDKCLISDNNSKNFGGGVYCSSSSPVILDCLIMNNVATGGGGIWCYYQSNPEISNTVICGNVSDQINGTWNDNGGNTVSDDCPLLCPDISGDGQVDITDLLEVISDWGLFDSLADVTNDGVVNVSDLLSIISNWGPCE